MTVINTKKIFSREVPSTLNDILAGIDEFSILRAFVLGLVSYEEQHSDVIINGITYPWWREAFVLKTFALKSYDADFYFSETFISLRILQKQTLKCNFL